MQSEDNQEAAEGIISEPSVAEAGAKHSTTEKHNGKEAVEQICGQPDEGTTAGCTYEGAELTTQAVGINKSTSQAGESNEEPVDGTNNVPEGVKNGHRNDENTFEEQTDEVNNYEHTAAVNDQASEAIADLSLIHI